jgi:hypothetical protein
MLGKWFYLCAPFSIIAQPAMDQDHWNAGAALQVMKLYAIDGNDFQQSRKLIDVTFRGTELLQRKE